MNKHTSGEWKYGWTNGTWRVTSGKTTVAWIDFWNTQECQSQKPEAEQEANARLIASAPELLEALRDCMEYIANSRGDGLPAIEERKAREAMAKAQGE